MKTTVKQQTKKVGGSGSFINQMMSNNNSIPVVGKGATRMGYSDRHVYEVIEVSKDGKEAKLEALDAEYAGEKGTAEMGHQNWKLIPTGRLCTVVWRNNAWKFKVKRICFTKEFIKKADKNDTSCYKLLTKELQDTIFDGNQHPQKVVEGITEEVFEYNKVNILFGSKDYYYDWSF